MLNTPLIYIYIYTHTIHIYIYTYTHIHTYTHTHTHTHEFTKVVIKHRHASSPQPPFCLPKSNTSAHHRDEWRMTKYEIYKMYIQPHLDYCDVIYHIPPVLFVYNLKLAYGIHWTYTRVYLIVDGVAGIFKCLKFTMDFLLNVGYSMDGGGIMPPELTNCSSNLSFRSAKSSARKCMLSSSCCIISDCSSRYSSVICFFRSS